MRGECSVVSRLSRLISPLATHNSTVTEQKWALLILGAIKCHWLSNNFIVIANVYRVIQKER